VWEQRIIVGGNKPSWATDRKAKFMNLFPSVILMKEIRLKQIRYTHCREL